MPTKKEKQPLSVTHPELAKEADGWDPATLDASSGQKVDWKCFLGHTWTTKLNYRVTRKTKCPFCLNQKVWVGFNDFSTTHPDMLDELIGSDGTDFVAGSTTKVLQWKCLQGHVYEARPQYRTVRKQGCPVCAGKRVVKGFNDLATTYPDIASEAFNFDPTELTAGSNVSVEWKCSHGHIFTARPHQRTTLNSGCAVCTGDQINIGVNDFETTDFDLAREAFGWDPRTVTRSSNKQRAWKCKLGHVWTTSVNSRTNMKSGCPVCDGRGLLSGFNDLQTRFPDVAAEADGWDPSLALSGTHKKYKWICAEGHKWSAPIKDRTLRGDGCPSCTKFGFDNNREAWIYFLEHETWGLFQIGITNHLKNRLNDHKRLGWEVLEISNPMEGFLAKEWEKSILDFLRSSGIELGNPNIAGTYSGYTETWYKRDLPIKSIKDLMRLTEKFEEND
jgi:plastocyanin